MMSQWPDDQLVLAGRVVSAIRKQLGWLSSGERKLDVTHQLII